MRHLSLFILFIALLPSCATIHPLVLDAVWENSTYEPRAYEKVAVFGMAKDLKNKKEFENDAVKYLEAKGIKAVAGYTLYEHEPEGDEVNQKDIKKELHDQGFDGVLSAAAIENISIDDEDISDNELESHAEGLYKFGQYFESRYDHLQSDIDHNHHKFSILEANFYYLTEYNDNDVDGNGLIWISHFKHDLEKTATQEKMEIDNYAHIVVNGLFEDGVILEP